MFTTACYAHAVALHHNNNPHISTQVFVAEGSATV